MKSSGYIYLDASRLVNYIHHYSPPVQGIVVYYKSVGVLMHDIDHDLAPQNLKNLLTRIFLVHSYNTRAAAAGISCHSVTDKTAEPILLKAWS